ncbi:YtxH domain-containing protein [Sporosarcina beigongshangi]|uniref:YtxH domain-containing protein n=1 Tax=Sporosarcina beigongshangi TaxID=2782538 RepID=UPI0019394BFA|nr:YtxH domain-containing protein [Sporosarcina beigongshangi]
MNENRGVRPNYNHEYNAEKNQYENSFGEPSYLPVSYESDRHYTDSFYEEEKGNSSAGSFLCGALVGGIIGAATALFLTPKSGSEMRVDFTAQAVQLKDKSIEISSVAKEKATELTSVAKEKTGELSKTIQEQSEQLVEKVKSMKSKTSVPMDDGTASSEGEEAMEFVEKATAKVEESLDAGKEIITSTAEAMHEAVVGKANTAENATTGNSNVSYDNSENVGNEKITNQNAVTDIIDKK